MVRTIDKVSMDIINITIVKKYLFISSKSKFILVNINLFINMFLGLLKDRIWFIENIKSEYILINLKPELVDKKDPPIITKIKYINVKLGWLELILKPIFEILLETDNKFIEKSVLKLKKRKKILIIIKKYIIKCKSS